MEVYMKKWLNGIAVGLLCAAAAAGCFYLIGEARLTKKIAGLKAQGVPTNFAELEAYCKPPEGTANAADIYLKAFAAYHELPDAEKQKLLPVMGCQIDPNDNEPYPAEQMAAATEFMTLNQEMFALLHEAGKVKDCYYPITYSLDFFPNDILHNIKSASQSLCIAGIYYSQTNQPQKAYDAAMDQLRLGQSLSRNQSLLNHLVRLAILAMGAHEIQDIINRTSLDEAQLQQLQGHLQQVSQSTTFKPVLLGETCFWLDSRKPSGWNKKNIPAVKAKAGQCTMNLFSWDAITLIDACQQMIAIDKLPIQEQLPKAKEAGDVILFSSLSRSVGSSVARVHNIHLRVRANMDCAITALAVERYRLKEGKLPETLDALVTGYLPGVYMDPFDGKPLRYKRDGTGYMIYNIGEDGVDNGGRGWDKTTKTQDWVFRVYR
jgi:hypothetical protein